MVKARAKSKAEGNEMKRGREKNYIRCLHGTTSTSNREVVAPFVFTGGRIVPTYFLKR